MADFGSSFQVLGAASNAPKNELNFSAAPQLQDEGVSPHRSDLNDHSQSSLKNVGLKKTAICDVHAHDLTGELIRDYVCFVYAAYLSGDVVFAGSLVDRQVAIR